MLLRPRRYSALIAAVVPGAGVAALEIYRYYDIKAFGPIPAMYEPIWFTEKTTALIAEIVAALAALGVIVSKTTRR